jgi:hypothetical protein
MGKPHPSCKSHPIYTLFHISNFVQRTSRLLTPEGAISDDCEIFSANIYAHSLFGNYKSSSVLVRFLSITGEDALADLLLVSYCEL